MDGLEGAVALVTGAARGIGKAIVGELVACGAKVVAVDRDGPTLSEVMEASDRPDALLGVTADVTDAEQMAAAVRQAEQRFGQVGVLVNNAGISAYFDVVEMTEADWDKVLSVDLKGAWICARAVIPSMRTLGRGSIVNIASIHATVTVDGMFPYAVAKSGLIGFTRSLALDLAPEGIRVNAVSPGWTRTQLVQEWFDNQPDPEEAERSVLRVHPMGRICEPAEIATAVRFLASDAASGMTGAEVAVDAGLGVRMPT